MESRSQPLRGAAGQPARALVIEDDASARLTLRRALERSGMEVVEADSGGRGLKAMYDSRPDLVLLEVELQEADGWSTLDRIRELTEVPLMVVSSRSSELEMVRALKAGADDYVTKPYGIQELLARTEALLRRARPREEMPTFYAAGPVEIDLRAAEARVDGRRLSLTPLEFRLLTAFVKHPNQVLSSDQLLALAWGDQGFARERVKIYVGYLRGKFREAGLEAPIETIRGFGYRYRPEPR